MRKEKELTAKEESFDAAIAAFSSSTTDAQIKEMKLQLENITVERNNLEMKFEEAVEDAGKIYIFFQIYFKFRKEKSQFS